MGLFQIISAKWDKDKETDEDKSFPLSLLPTFKKFNEDQQFVAWTEIINVIRGVYLSRSHYNKTSYGNTLYHDTTQRPSNISNISSYSAISSKEQEVWYN